MTIEEEEGRKFEKYFSPPLLLFHPSLFFFQFFFRDLVFPLSSHKLLPPPFLTHISHVFLIPFLLFHIPPLSFSTSLPFLHFLPIFSFTYFPILIVSFLPSPSNFFPFLFLFLPSLLLHSQIHRLPYPPSSMQYRGIQ